MKKLHLICNSHIDPVWLWTLDEGKGAALSTFNSALNLLDEHDFIFCHNESFLYEFIKETVPEMYERIKKHVKNGKWKIMGGWYIQPDCMLASGETYVRLIRRGLMFFKEEFGVKPTTAINLDAFGHSVGLVQIMAKNGFDSCIVCRPHFDFWPADKDWITWKGVDGSQIKVIRDKFHYSSEMGKATEKIQNTIAYYDKQEKEIGLSLWGVGNHGGGPSRKDLDDIKKLQAESNVAIVHSTPEEAMKEVTAEQDYTDSLIPVFPGVYTSVRLHKEKFSALQQKFILAEKLCSISSFFYGTEYPTERLQRAEKKLLFNTFHDILAGTATEKGMQEAISDLEYGISEVGDIIANTHLRMAMSLKPSGQGAMPICVFNPHPYTIKTVVEGEFILPKIFFDKQKCKLTVTDASGKVLASQTIKESSNFNVHWQKRVAFECELPPFAVEKYDVRFEFVDEETVYEPLASLDNVDFYVYNDNEDPWAQKQEQYIQMGASPEKIPFIGERIVENGALFTVYEKQYAYNRSKIIVNEKHYRESEKVDLALRVYWFEENKMLKMHVNVGEGEYIGQIPFGTKELYQDQRESCSQYFTGVRQKDKVKAVINNGVYGSSYKDGIIMVSLLRSGCYAAHPATEEDTGFVRPLVDANRYVPHFDQGLLQYEFRLIEAEEKYLDREADEFNQRPYAVSAFPCGEREKIQPNISIASDCITLVAFKKAEETQGYILRFINNTNSKEKATIQINNAIMEYEFMPYEVSTFVYNGSEIYKANEMII